MTTQIATNSVDLSDPQVVDEILTVWYGDVMPPGGWRRIAWNFCWRFGADCEFPHSEEVTAELKRQLREDLVRRDAPAHQVDALVVWAVEMYTRYRKSQIRDALHPSPDAFRTPPFFVVADLPPMMRGDEWRDPFRPLVQYAKDWGSRPYDREQMMADPPPPDTEFGIAVSIATVVHALCDQDEMTPPDWVLEYRYERPMRVWGINSPISDSEYCQDLVANAPRACHYHNLFFDHTFIEGYLWLNPPPRRPDDRQPVETSGLATV